jgi:hypothetical protein
MEEKEGKRLIDVGVTMIYQVENYFRGVDFNGKFTIKSGSAGWANLATFVGRIIETDGIGLKSMQILKRIHMDIFIRVSGLTKKDTEVIIAKNPYVVSDCCRETKGRYLFYVKKTLSEKLILEAFLIYKFLVDACWDKEYPHPYLESQFFRKFIEEELALGNLKEK